jgi:hypothetical protein
VVEIALEIEGAVVDRALKTDAGALKSDALALKSDAAADQRIPATTDPAAGSHRRAVVAADIPPAG